MNIKGRLAISLVVVLAAIFFLMPHVKEDLPPWWSQYSVNLGLDLQGGMHLVLGVDQDEAVKGVMERLGDEIEENLADKHIRLKRIKVEDYQTLKLSLLSESDVKETTETLAGDFPQLVMSSTAGGEIILSLSQSEVDFIKKRVCHWILEIINVSFLRCCSN